MAGYDGFAEAGPKTCHQMAGYDGFAKSGRKTSFSLAGSYGFAKAARSHAPSFPCKPGFGYHFGTLAVCKTVVPRHKRVRKWVSVCKPVFGCHIRPRFHAPICKPVTICHFRACGARSRGYDSPLKVAAVLKGRRARHAACVWAPLPFGNAACAWRARFPFEGARPKEGAPPPKQAHEKRPASLWKAGRYGVASGLWLGPRPCEAAERRVACGGVTCGSSGAARISARSRR